MEKIVLVIHVLAALGVIGLVLVQHGKGADMGASFGGGASGSLFGVSGSSNFLSRATAVCVIIFFSTSLTLAYLAGHKQEGDGSVVKAFAAKTSTEKTIPVESVSGTTAASLPAANATGASVTSTEIPK